MTFRYKPDSQDVLKNVSLTIRSAKSSALSDPRVPENRRSRELVQRFYIPNDGQVFVDGQDIAQIDPAWLRSNIGVVLQENLLFNRSIHDNIALVNPAMSREAVMRMARLSGADEFIAKLPNGYETQIEERGANLLGASASASRSPVLSRPIRPSLFSMRRPALWIMKANASFSPICVRSLEAERSSLSPIAFTVRHCNRIIGMKDGRVVEEGTHDSLTASGKGLYAHLWALQNGTAQ